MAALQNRRSYSFDVNLQLKDAGLVAASAAAQVNSSNQILDFGTAPLLAMAVIDVSAIETDSSDEVYEIIIEGSNSSSFAGNAAVTLAELKLGHATPLAAGLKTSVVGRYELPFCNVQVDTVYEYVRAYTKVAGTVATGINYTCFLSIITKGP